MALGFDCGVSIGRIFVRTLSIMGDLERDFEEREREMEFSGDLGFWYDEYEKLYENPILKALA